MENKKIREVIKVFKAVNTSDGAGVSLKRSIGMPEISYVDPFLMLDEFGSDIPGQYIAGFPSHPHRGFETVTYMLNGSVRHEDSVGNVGELHSGGVQWMTAGRGVIHSEMPMQDEGLMRGFQLWVNLPKAEKMREPRYQNIEPNDVPEVKLSNGGLIRVVAGEVENTKGPVEGIVTEPVYLDVQLPPQAEYIHYTPAAHNVCSYPFEGSADFGSGQIERSHAVAFSWGHFVHVKAGKNGVRYLLIAAHPIGEPVFRGGPFVMNTRDEIIQAYRDYDDGKMG
ncbi:MAG: pirin family protein [Spirochaetia bacterium]|nr:pirin family protein [Spirochaetia bacterium]